MPAVSVVRFRRDHDSIIETGVAVLSAPRLYDAFLIFPEDGTSPADALTEVWWYTLAPEEGAFQF